MPNENHRRTSLGSVSGMAIRQLLDEADSKVARTDPLYSIGPGYDGLYHCPFDQSESCGHKPTKLKCNYEYVIDDIFLKCFFSKTIFLMFPCVLIN